MSNNKSIQILRGSTSYNPNNVELLDGQPFYSKQSGKFYIGVDGNSKQTFCNESQVDSKVSNEARLRQAEDTELWSKLNAEISRSTTFDDTHDNLKNGTGDCSIVQLSSGTLSANGKYSAALGDYYRTSVPSTVTGDTLAIKNIYNKAGLVTNDYIYHNGCIAGDSNFTFSGQIKAGDRNSVFSINSIPKGFDSFIAGGQYNVSFGGTNLTSGYINFNSGYGNTVLGAKNMIDFSDGVSNNSNWDKFGLSGSTYNLISGNNNYVKHGNSNLLTGFDNRLTNSSKCVLIGEGNRLTNSSNFVIIGNCISADSKTDGLLIGNKKVQWWENRNFLEIYGCYATESPTYGTLFSVNARGSLNLGCRNNILPNSTYSFAMGQDNTQSCWYSGLIGRNLTSTRNEQLIVGISNDTSDKTSMFAVANGGKNIFAVSPDNTISKSKITNIEGRLKNPRLESMYIATNLKYWKQQTPVTTISYIWTLNETFTTSSFGNTEVDLTLTGETLKLQVKTPNAWSYETLIDNEAGKYEGEDTYVPDSTVTVTAAGSSFFTFCKSGNTLYFPENTVTLDHIDTWDPPALGISIFYTSTSMSVTVSAVRLQILSNSSMPSININKTGVFNGNQMSTASYHHSIGSISSKDYIHIEETKNGITRATFDKIQSGDYRPIYFDFDKNN